MHTLGEHSIPWAGGQRSILGFGRVAGGRLFELRRDDDGNWIGGTEEVMIRWHALYVENYRYSINDNLVSY